MADWIPITVDELRHIVTTQLHECDTSDLNIWLGTKLNFEPKQLQRFTDQPSEPVFVVAALKDAVIFYDDVEDGFGIARNDAVIRNVYWYERLVYAIRNLTKIADELENGNS